MIVRIFPLLAFCLFFKSPIVSAQGVKSELKKFSSNEVMARGSISFSAQDLSSSKLIISFNGSKLLIPASNQKVLTTAAALSILGSEYTFKTYLEYQGNIDKDGVLEGNIFIRGEGDPTLGSGRFIDGNTWSLLIEDMCKRISDLGIKKVNGEIVGDASYFEFNAIPDYWIWTDLGNYYGAGVYGLNINENLYKLNLRPGKAVGDTVGILGTEPVIPSIQFLNFLKTGPEGSGDNGYIYGAPFTSLRTITGTIPKGGNLFSIKGSMPDPAYFLAAAIKTGLEKKNIIVSETGRSEYLYKGIELVKRNQIYVYSSPTLKEIIKETNVNSINLYAEALLKAIGKKVFNEGSTKAGVKALQEFWAGKGIEPSSIVIFDGSGLSTFNWICSEAFTKALVLMSREKYYTDFYKSLPVAGVSGTLRRIGKGTRLENNMRAKSGSMKRVLCYSGYLKNPDTGKEYAFSIMVNNFECSNAHLISQLENILLLLQAGKFD